MIFKRLLLKNFLAIGETPVEIIFPDTNGLCIIKGINNDVAGKSSNGSGKSTIVEGILFCLYGTTLRKLKMNNVAHNGAKGECRTEIEYDNVKIVRTINRGKGKVELYVDGQSVTTDASVPEIKKEIERRLNVNFETMCNILIFGQHNMISFLDAGEPEKRDIVENLMNLAEYNAGEEIVRTMTRELKTNLKIYQESHIVHTKRINEQILLKDKQEQSLKAYQANLDVEIEDIRIRLEKIPNTDFVKKEWIRYNVTVAKRDELNDLLNKHRDKHNDVLNQIRDLMAQKQKDAEQRSPLVEKKEALLQKKSTMDERRRKIEEEMIMPLKEVADNLLNNISTKKSECLNKKNGIQCKENWNALLSTAAREVEDKEKICNILRSKKLNHNETCPECFGKIDINNCANVLKHREDELSDRKLYFNAISLQASNDKSDVAARILQLENECKDSVTKLLNEHASVLSEISDTKKQIDKQYCEASQKLDMMLENIIASIDDFDKSIDATYAERLSGLDYRNSDLKQRIDSMAVELCQIEKAHKPEITLEQLAKIEAEAESDRKLLVDKQRARKENPYAEIIKSLMSSVSTIDTEIKDVESKIKDCEFHMPYYEWFMAAFGKEGIKSFVIDQIIPTLNQQIEYWMQIIYQGAISVKFDKFLNVEMVNNASKNEMVFGQGSGGERRRIDIAIMLAFREIMQMSTGRNPNLCFFDEVAENLDEEGIYRLHDTLNDIAKNNRVFVITHNPVLLELMQNSSSITVTKKNGEMTM